MESFSEENHLLYMSIVEAVTISDLKIKILSVFPVVDSIRN